MTDQQVAALGPVFTEYLDCFQSCFLTKNTFDHLRTYCRGLISDLARKSVEPIALAAGAAVRTLQEFLTHHVWDHDGLLGRLQRRIVEQHLPAPGQAAADALGTVGLIDETSVAKKGNKTPGVQRQYCGSLGKVENCIVTVHLAQRGINYVAEVPKSFMCWPTLPKYDSLQAPFAAKRAENAATWGKPFRDQDWQTVQLNRQTLAPQTWKVKAAQVHLQQDHRPTDRTYWLIVARNVETAEVKYFISNAPPHTSLATLLKVAFCRWGVEHAFRLVKSEIGLGHFEGRSWKGLLRHMILCQAVMLFVAEQTTRLRGEKPAADDGADGPRPQRRLPALAGAPTKVIGHRARGVGDPIPSGQKSSRQKLAAAVRKKERIAL